MQMHVIVSGNDSIIGTEISGIINFHGKAEFLREVRKVLAVVHSMHEEASIRFFQDANDFVELSPMGGFVEHRDYPHTNTYIENVGYILGVHDGC